MRWMLPCLLVLCVACGSSRRNAAPTPAGAKPVHGQYPLAGSITAPECGGGYSILGAGVTVKNETGTVIGSATTSASDVYPAPTPLPVAEDAVVTSWNQALDVAAKRSAGSVFAGGQRVPFVTPTPLPPEIARDYDAQSHAKLAALTHCRSTFSLSVPKAGFYQVEVGTHGGRPYSFDELQTQGWHLDLTLN